MTHLLLHITEVSGHLVEVGVGNARTGTTLAFEETEHRGQEPFKHLASLLALDELNHDLLIDTAQLDVLLLKRSEGILLVALASQELVEASRNLNDLVLHDADLVP